MALKCMNIMKVMTFVFSKEKEVGICEMFLLNCRVRNEALLGMVIYFYAVYLGKALSDAEYWVQMLNHFGEERWVFF